MVWVYKADGSLQCGVAPGISVEDMRPELARVIGDANIVAQEKRQIPGFVISLCGAPTGAVNAYELNAEGYQLWRDGIAGQQGFELWAWGPGLTEAGGAARFAGEPGVPFPMKDVVDDLLSTGTEELKFDPDKFRALIGAISSPRQQPVLLRDVIGRTIRVIRPGDGITLDFRWDRVNFIVDEAGVVKDIRFH